MSVLKQFFLKTHFMVLVCLWGHTLYAFEPPPLSAPVVDRANVIAADTERLLNSALKKLRQNGGAQISVLTVRDLNGVSIEQAAIKTVDQWQLGGREKDDGALLLVAIGDRKVRIEVGQGLEGDLTDATSKQIIEQAILPMFRSGDIGGGVLVGVFQMAKVTHPQLDVEAFFGQDRASDFRPKRKRSTWGTWIYILALFFLIFFGRGGFLGFLLGASMGRGYRGGFGGGFGGGSFGGGWSGGGGGFSGGGASGGW